MRLIKEEEFKTVEYFGIPLQIRSDCRYIATDKNGEVYSFRDRPFVTGSCGGCIWRDSDEWYDYELVATVDLEGMDFKDTLVEYSNESNV